MFRIERRLVNECRAAGVEVLGRLSAINPPFGDEITALPKIVSCYERATLTPLSRGDDRGSRSRADYASTQGVLA